MAYYKIVDTKMAKLIVEIKSKEMIKPFSPTPDHLKTLKLSFVDQAIIPSVHIAFILYFKAPITQSADDLLKKSLSKTLVQYYPLAGRIEEGSVINCNDEGALCSIANVFSSLAEVIEDPNPEELRRLLPITAVDGNNSILAGVQVNHFRCGGMAISVSISHKVADGATVAAFVFAWATNTSSISQSDIVSPLNFDSAALFPPMDLEGVLDPDDMICKEKTVVKRFIFDKDMINRLRERVVDQGEVKAPTKVELVSAFLWKQFISIAKAKPTPPKIFCATQAVNLRTINMSPIPQDSLGNIVWPTFAYAPVETETSYSEAVAKLRTAVKQIDKSYFGKIQTGECLFDISNADISPGDADACAISSCTKFPTYEVNFGWGTPTWASINPIPIKNAVFLLSTKCGQGIEAWANILEQDADALQRQHHFLSLAFRSIQPKL